MEYKRHAEFTIEVVELGREKARLLVVDSLVHDPDSLRQAAAAARFVPAGMAYPGVRAQVPESYASFLMQQLAALLPEHFDVSTEAFRMMMCHYSLVTTPPAELALMQRIPHVDVIGPDGFATVHYLFQPNLGGTSFYRHRATGFETIDKARQHTYIDTLQRECEVSGLPKAAYINRDSALFEKIASADAVCNRMLIYRGNSLHSGSIADDFKPDANPLTGRLTINSFVAPVYRSH